MQRSPIQTAKSNSSTKFFDMTFKTEDEKFRAVCFSPEKRRRLEKYFESGTSCQVTNVMTGNNKMEVKLTNFSSIKPKTVPFKNEKIEWQYHTIDDIINEIEPATYVNIKFRVVSRGEINNKGTYKLREHVITDDGVNTIILTMFGDLVDKLEEKHVYSLVNCQVTTFMNKKRLKSSYLSVAEEVEGSIPDLSSTEVEEELASTLDSTTGSAEVKIRSIDDGSLCSVLSCNECAEQLIESGNKKLHKCESCGAVQLVSMCKSKIMVSFTSSTNEKFQCEGPLIRDVLPNDIEIGDNEDFLIFMLSKTFAIEHVNGKITNISVK